MNPQKTPKKACARGGRGSRGSRGSRGGRGGRGGRRRYTRYEDDPDYVYRGKKNSTTYIPKKFVRQMGEIYKFYFFYVHKRHKPSINLTLILFKTIVTRQTSELLAEHGIKRELSVQIKRNFVIDSLAYLNKPTQPTQPTSIRSNPSNPVRGRRARRARSVAGTNLYDVGNTITETGFDFLGRVPRSNRVNIGQQTTPTFATIAMAENSLNVGASTSQGFTSAHFDSSYRDMRHCDSTDSTDDESSSLGKVGEPDAPVQFLHDSDVADVATGISTSLVEYDDPDHPDARIQFLYDSDDSDVSTLYELQDLFIERAEQNGASDFGNEEQNLENLFHGPSRPSEQNFVDFDDFEYFADFADFERQNLFIAPIAPAVDDIGGIDAFVDDDLNDLLSAIRQTLNIELPEADDERPKKNKGDGDSEPAVDDIGGIAGIGASVDDHLDDLLNAVQTLSIELPESDEQQHEPEATGPTGASGNDEVINPAIELHEADQQQHEQATIATIASGDDEHDEHDEVINAAIERPEAEQQQNEQATIESGDDKVINSVNTSGAIIFNDFNPFQRLPQSIPFTLNGRPRAVSIDSVGFRYRGHRRMSCLAEPNLETIVEEDGFGTAVEKLFECKFNWFNYHQYYYYFQPFRLFFILQKLQWLQIH